MDKLLRLGTVVGVLLTAVATSAVFIAGDGLPLGAPKSASALDNAFVPRLIAGGGALGHSGNGVNAVCPTAPGCAGQTVGRINYPIGMAVHPVTGDFFFSQGAHDNASELNRDYVSIRQVTAAGTLQTVIGDDLQYSSCTSSCDGAVNTSTQQLRNPGHIVFNSLGTKLFVLDGFGGLREVTFAGTPSLPSAITTVSHSQIPASINSMAQVIHTGGLALDSNGALYFGGRVLDQGMSSLLRTSVFKRTAAGLVTEIVSSNGAASGAPTQKQGLDQFSGPRDIKVVGEDIYVLYDNKLIRTNLSGNLEAEYTLTNTVQARSVAILDSTIYVGLTNGGRVVTFPDDAPNSTAVTPTQTVRFGTAGNDIFALGSTQVSIELTGPRSMMVNNGALYISDMNQQILFSAIIAIVAPPAITPATQTVLGTTGSAVTASTDLIASNFTGAVSYAVTTGSLPAGLSLNPSTGVVSGTPTGMSTATVTITATGATTGTATATITFAIVNAPVVTPATQTVSGATGTAIMPSTAFTASNFTGAVSYAVTTGSLPAGLSLSLSTGVVSGTPTAASTATVIITATGATAGSTTTTITFSIATAPAATVAPVVSTASTVPVANNAATPTLVTSANQTALTAAPGGASVLINGVAVTPQIVTASNSAAAQADPTERTPEQVRELQQAASVIETRLDTIAGGDSGVSVVRTDTGAVMTGIFSGTRVPVEDVVIVNAANTATLFAARDVRGNIVEVKPGAVLEVTANGDVAVQAFGLTPGESVELVVMSTPTLLGNYTVDAKGIIKTSAKLPTNIGSGNHSLVVASPSVKASLGLKLVKSTETLPVTGSSTNDLTNWAVAVLLSGVYVLMVSRSRRRSYRF